MNEVNIDPAYLVPKEYSSKNRIHWVTQNLDKFCVLPWLNLNTNTNGYVKLCCAITIDHHVSDYDSPFNLGYDDIETIWNSMYMSIARTGHRKNEGAYECQDCYKLEKVSGHSPRKGQNETWTNRKYNDPELNEYLAKVADNRIYPVAEQLPISLELRLGNQCNLKCISCWGMSSSLIQEERKQILVSEKLVDHNLLWLHNKWEEEVEQIERLDVKEWYETDMFYKNFRKMAPKLRRLYTTGGEPTLIKANYRMLEELIAAGNTKCRIEFTSNMAAWNPKFYEALSQFDKVEVQMSIDGVANLAEYIRYGSEWNKVRENVITVMNMSANKPGWKINVFTVLQAMNYANITEIWEFLHEVAEQTQKDLFWWPITLTNPDHLSLAAIEQEQRLAAIPKIDEVAAKYTKENIDKFKFKLGHDAIRALKDSITNTAFDQNLNKKFSNYKRFLDNYRAANV